MRNLIFAINITVDGNCAHTEVLADDELHEYMPFCRSTHDRRGRETPVGRHRPEGKTPIEARRVEDFQIRMCGTPLSETVTGGAAPCGDLFSENHAIG